MSIIRWFKTLSIRGKILILVILGVIGVAGISGFAKYSTLKKNTYMTVLQQSQLVETVMLQTMMAEERFINTLNSQELSGLEGYRQSLDEALALIKTSDVGSGIARDAAAMSQAQAEHARVFETVARGLDEMSKAKAGLFAKIELVNSNLKKIISALDKEEAMLFTQGETLALDKAELNKDLGALLVLLSDKVMNIQDLLLHGDSSKYQETAQAIEKKLELKQKNIGLAVSTYEAFKEPWQSAQLPLSEIAGIEKTIFESWGRNNDLKKALEATVAQIQEKSKSISESSRAIIESRNRAADKISLAVSLGGIFLLGGLGFLMSRSINESLQQSIAGLMESADQVATASSQVSAASQQLAGGASQQAASIEQTSASLEEISSMTKQNAENAIQANELMAEARQAVEKANGSMLQVTESMGQITRANLETQKIIKTIDEIAFQTNLLALNAAVEAARAGESGAGFAVVADEVRSLAMRAAEAAKNTENLIEGTVKTVKEGAGLVEAASREFGSVATTVSKSGELIGEIAEASKEQAGGIEQVSRAVLDLDKVVQSNAGNAEESAAASEQMNAQAEQMKVYVNGLNLLVDGAKRKRAASNGKAKTEPGSNAAAAKRAVMRTEAAGNAKIQPAVHAAHEENDGGTHFHKSSEKGRQVKKTVRLAEEMIPFEEGDF